jgi:hypothetical protein
MQCHIIFSDADTRVFQVDKDYVTVKKDRNSFFAKSAIPLGLEAILLDSRLWKFMDGRPRLIRL